MTTNNDAKTITKVLVVGAGGVGFWLTTALARELSTTLIEVWDDDTLEGGQGYRRLPKSYDPKESKLTLLEGFETMVMGDGGNVRYKQRRWDGTEGADEQTLVVDCTDMGLEPRREMWAWARKSGAEVMRVSYDGNGVVVVAWGLPLSGPPGGGYALVPNMAQSFMAAGMGAEAILRFVQNGERVEEFQFRVGGDVDA